MRESGCQGQIPTSRSRHADAACPGHFGNRANLLKRNEALLFACRKLDVPVVSTEQFPKGGGPTEPRCPGLTGDVSVYEKIHFNAAAETEFLALLPPAGWQEIVGTGTEAHACFRPADVLGTSTPWLPGEAFY